MLRRVVAVSLITGLLCGQDHVANLRAADWRVRNAAAAALAALPDAAFDVSAVVAVLTSPWQGPQLAEPGRYGGRSRPSREDPLQRVVLDAGEEVAGAWRVVVARDAGEREVGTAARLVVPWHPHELAAWLLQQRRALFPVIAEAFAAVPLTSRELCTTWLRVQDPDLPALLARAGDGSDLDELAHALWHEGATGRASLRALLAQETRPWRRVVLWLGDPELLGDDAALRAAFEQFLGDPDRRHARQAGHVLSRSGAAVVPLAARALRRPADVPRVLALLCSMDGAAGAAGGELAPFLTGTSGVAMERALAVIARAPIDAAHRPALAAAAFALVNERKGVALRVLALDALANLGDGVDGTMRQQLVAMLEAPAADGIRARLLGCLHRLGVATPLTTERKLAMCTMVNATVDTWLAAADDGEAALPRLVASLRAPKSAELRGPCFARLAQRAPQGVAALLASEHETLRLAALVALRKADAGSVPTPRLVELTQDSYPFVARAALDWLGERADLAPHAEPVLTALATHLDWSAPGLAGPLLRTLGVSPPQWLQRLSPRLARGDGWEFVRELPPAARRAELRRLLTDTVTEDKTRAQLLGELLRIGIEGDAEIGWVRDGLRAGIADGFAAGLAATPSVPPDLRPDLERCIDVALTVADGMSDASALGRAARLALVRAAAR